MARFDAKLSTTPNTPLTTSDTIASNVGWVSREQVDDADFVVFVAAYDVLDCADGSMVFGCPADFNDDRLVDDADFVAFVGAYNELVCP